LTLFGIVRNYSVGDELLPLNNFYIITISVISVIDGHNTFAMLPSEAFQPRSSRLQVSQTRLLLVRRETNLVSKF